MRRPHFIAEQSRDATGLLGRLVAFVMARETWSQNQRAIDALDILECDHILDVGCGHGRSLGALAQRACTGRVVGADPSETMVEIAVQRNRRLVKARRIEVAIAGAERLPFRDGAFDKVLCVHVVYFWTDIDAALKEIARVLKPGGCLVLLFRTNADGVAVQSYPAEIYRFPALATVGVALEGVGFVVDEATELLAEPALVRSVKVGP